MDLKTYRSNSMAGALAEDLIEQGCRVLIVRPFEEQPCQDE